MKLSWKLINNFIKLDYKNIDNLEKQLAICGIELENIKKLANDNDQTLELGITTNRKEISSALSLSIEINTIINTNLLVNPIKLKGIARNNWPMETNNFNYIRVHALEVSKLKATPKQIKIELQKNYIKEEDTITNIQKYVEVKWGKTFEIVNCNDLENIDEDVVNRYNFGLETMKEIISKKSKRLKYKLLIFSTEQTIDHENVTTYDCAKFYENMYYDSMKLISTTSQDAIGKYYEVSKANSNRNINIVVRKSSINKILGNTNGRKFQFIKTNQVEDILSKLQLIPKYNKKHKSFKVTIPSHRSHDLKREIDIIEEIGRINKFEKFSGKVEKIITTKIQENNLKKIRDIRYTLRNLGFNEVLNSCLVINRHNIKNQVKINNPINIEQKELRTSIVENLIQNYTSIIKYTDKNIELFEIGKTFKCNIKRIGLKDSEAQHIGGLIYNKNYYRSNWTEKPQGIKLLHAKGILETFLEKISANVHITNINFIKDNNSFTNVINLLKVNKTMGIYANNTNILIGILGEVKNSILNQKKRNRVYIFEIDLKKLNKNSKKNSHLQNNYKPYSKYPSTARDISIKLDKSVSFEKIKINVLRNCKQFVESVDIFNEYINTNKERFIGIRITYRSDKTTLRNEDIELLNEKTRKVIADLK